MTDEKLTNAKESTPLQEFAGSYGKKVEYPSKCNFQVSPHSSPDGKRISGNEDMKLIEGNVYSPEWKPLAEPEIPSRYNIVIPMIVQSLEAGFICFLNPDTLEIEQVSGKMPDNTEAFYASTGIFYRDKPLKHLFWNNYLMFEPVPEEDLSRMTKDFMQIMTDNRLYEKLARLMKKQLTFVKINAVINKSKHSSGWAEYKIQYFENYVRQKLIFLLNYYR